MNLVRYEVRIGFFKGLLLGVRHYPFESEEVYEEDIVFYLGVIQLVITRIYQKD